MKNFVVFIMMSLIPAFVFAKTEIIPLDPDIHVAVNSPYIECTTAGEALVITVAWGGTSQEFFKALARENGLDENNLDRSQGPFRTYRDYAKGIEAHRKLYIQLLRQKGFSPLSLLKINPADGSIAKDQDGQAFALKLEGSLQKTMLEIAQEKGWSTMAIGIQDMDVEVHSPRCPLTSKP